MLGLRRGHSTLFAFGGTTPIDKRLYARIVSLDDVLMDVLSRMVGYACPVWEHFFPLVKYKC